MSRPNPYAKLNVLVCDGRLSESKDIRKSYGDYPMWSLPATEAIGRVLGENVKITRVDDLAQVIREVSSKPIPHYSLVVYASYHITNNMGGMKIRDINEMDPYLPQMVYGTEINHDNLSKADRHGNRYYAGDIKKLEHDLRNIFYKPKEPLKNLVVFKYGGSVFDFRKQNPGKQNLRYAVEEVSRIKKESPKEKGKPKKQVIAVVGSGQIGEEIKDHISTFPDAKKQLGLLIAEALTINSRLVYTLMDPSVSQFLKSEDFYFVHKENARRVLVMPMAPHYVLARDDIPLEDTDTGTFASAELFGSEDTSVILLKRTDGIYDFDPNIGGFTGDYGRWITNQKGNRRHSTVTIEDLLSGKISREGTDSAGNRNGSTGHLLEDSSLEYLANCKNIKEVLIVPIAPEEMHYKIAENTYKHVITGDEISVDPQTGWRGVLEQNIRDAFQGKALSRIVRG